MLKKQIIINLISVILFIILGIYLMLSLGEAVDRELDFRDNVANSYLQSN